MLLELSIWSRIYVCFLLIDMIVTMLLLLIELFLLVLWFNIYFCILGSDDWAITSNPLDLHNARLLAIAAVDYQVPDTDEHEDCVNVGTGGTTLCQCFYVCC